MQTIATGGGGLTTLGTRVPRSLNRRLRLYCALHDIHLRRFIEDAMREWLAAQRRPRRRLRALTGSSPGEGYFAFATG
jgi:hypothetical protein